MHSPKVVLCPPKDDLSQVETFLKEKDTKGKISDNFEVFSIHALMLHNTMMLGQTSLQLMPIIVIYYYSRMADRFSAKMFIEHSIKTEHYLDTRFTLID